MSGLASLIGPAIYVAVSVPLHLIFLDDAPASVHGIIAVIWLYGLYASYQAWRQP